MPNMLQEMIASIVSSQQQFQIVGKLAAGSDLLSAIRRIGPEVVIAKETIMPQAKAADARYSVNIVAINETGQEAALYNLNLRRTTLGTISPSSLISIIDRAAGRRSTTMSGPKRHETTTFEAEQIEFTLPRGYVDGGGALHRRGVMRRATAADEILSLEDPRVQDNPAYLIIILLSRVVTRLGETEDITTKVIESLFAADLVYLQALYQDVNSPKDDGGQG